MDFSLLYITTKDKAEAVSIGRALVEERLAACANIIEPMTSVYFWEGTLHEEKEAVLILKTKTKLAVKATTRVKSLHSYSCPCVLAIPVTSGNDDYMRWLDKGTI